VGLARGYHHRPDLTGERFLPNPFGPGRIYNTGDLARRLPDGRIVCLGRADHQVKVRGYRIELGEIEAVLEKHTAVEQAVVVAREESVGLKQLVGYVVPNREHAMPPVSDVRAHLQQQLPDYMIPAVYVALDQFPLTPNGKVDRNALPEPASQRLDTGRMYVAPEDEIESVLAEIWQEVLGVERVGIQDYFFDLGGHSLNMLLVVDMIEQKLDLQIPVRMLFESPTIERLAQSIRDPEAQLRKSGLFTLWSSFTDLFNRGRDRVPS
jgi:acyl carrier protein